MMNDSGGGEQGAGLCERCVNVKIVESARGSRFYLCQLSATDPRFPKYRACPCFGAPASGRSIATARLC